MFKDKYYRPDEVAEALSVDKSTVYRLCKDLDDPMPAIRLGGKGPLRIHGVGLNEWLKRRKVNPGDE